MNQLTLKQAVKQCFSKIFTFKGRSSRDEYWLFVIGITLLFNFFDGIFGFGNSIGQLIGVFVYHQRPVETYSVGLAIFRIGFIIISLLLCLSVTARRFHDVGKSGWWTLFSLVPIVNIWGFFFLIRKSDYDNKYGTVPVDVIYRQLSLKETWTVFKKNLYAFELRCDRDTYWLSQVIIHLIFFPIVFIVGIPFGIVIVLMEYYHIALYNMWSSVFSIVLSLGLLALIIILFIGGLYFAYILLALTVRRLHDVNRSGWWILINLVPVIGSVFFTYQLVKPSDGDNKYGEQLKGEVLESSTI